MLTRMVSISWPHDPPASASESAGITCVSYRAWPLLYFSAPSIHLYSSLSCPFLLAFHQIFFWRFLVSLHWDRTCSFSSKKFVITHLLKPVSVNSSDSFSIQLCSLAGEELCSLGGGEAFWFWIFFILFIPIFVDLSTCGLCIWWLLDGASEWTSFLLMMKLFLSAF